MSDRVNESVGVTVKVHIDVRGFRDDQGEGDVFELYFGHDPYWLNEAEVLGFAARLQAAVESYRAAIRALAEAAT